MASCTGGWNIRIGTAVRLYLLLEMLVADCDHGAVRALRAAINALALLVDLGTVALSADEDDVALVNSCVVRAAVRSLLVASSQACPASVVLLADRIAAEILPVVAKIE